MATSDWQTTTVEPPASGLVCDARTLLALLQNSASGLVGDPKSKDGDAGDADADDVDGDDEINLSDDEPEPLSASAFFGGVLDASVLASGQVRSAAPAGQRHQKRTAPSTASGSAKKSAPPSASGVARGLDSGQSVDGRISRSIQTFKEQISNEVDR